MVGTQRAVVYHEPGTATVLQVEEVPVPKRGQGEVLVKQYSTSVNPVDYKMRQDNKDHLPKASPCSCDHWLAHARQMTAQDFVVQIPGGDIAGVVVEADSSSKVDWSALSGVL